MAGTTVSARPTSHPQSAEFVAAQQIANLVADLEVLRAGLAALAGKYNATLTKMDSDAGITDTNYNALGAATVTTYDAAGDLVAASLTLSGAG